MDLIEQTAIRINQSYRRTGIRCVLLPIGYATGHEDIIPLREIYKRTNPNAAILADNCNIWDIMYIIKNSKGYIGTSLHGCITAMSFSKPHVAFCNKAQKIIEFCDTWNCWARDIKFIDNDSQFIEFVTNMDEENKKYISSVLNMKNKVHNYFDNDVLNIIKKY